MVSWNSCTPKSPILTGCSIVNQPIWIPQFMEPPKEFWFFDGEKIWYLAFAKKRATGHWKVSYLPSDSSCTEMQSKSYCCPRDSGSFCWFSGVPSGNLFHTYWKLPLKFPEFSQETWGFSIAPIGLGFVKGLFRTSLFQFVYTLIVRSLQFLYGFVRDFVFI